jgi:hypothetical protein
MGIAITAPDCPQDDSDENNLGQTPNPPRKTPRKPRRRLKMADIKALASLVVKYRLNEREACLELGIAPKTWANFKLRHKTQEAFEEMINGIRAAQLRNCITSIDNAGNDKELESVNKKGESVTITKPGDWRAKAWIAERVLSPERFGQQQAQSAAPQVNVYQAIGIDISKLLAEGAAKAVVDVQAVKQLPAPAPEHKSE